MSVVQTIRRWIHPEPVCITQEIGREGEEAARRFLEKSGLTFLCANYRGHRGEIDLIFKGEGILIFIEVKSRTSNSWTRPAAAVDAGKRRRISKTALEYLRQCRNPEVSLRFDVVEVLTVDRKITEVRHIEDAFGLASPYRYG